MLTPLKPRGARFLDTPMNKIQITVARRSVIGAVAACSLAMAAASSATAVAKAIRSSSRRSRRGDHATVRALLERGV